MPNIRIAVSGLANAGKTIFITQLIAHLEHFKKSRFNLGPGRTIAEVKRVPLKKDGVQPFPYDEARAHLLGRDPGWPPATRAVSGIVLEFTLVDEMPRFFSKSKKRTHYRLEIYDFPGELLGDLNLPDREFAVWSVDTLRRLSDPTSPLKRAGTAYLPVLEDLSGIEPSRVVRAYHDALERAISRGATAVTPAGWIYSRGNAAASPPVEFAPLPDTAPEALRKVLSAAYERYRLWLRPQTEVFRQCDRHAILVDVLEILRGGQDRYVERKASLREIVRFYREAHGLLERLARDTLRFLRIPVTASRSPLLKAVIVATKADAILEEDRGRLADLLREMLESDFRALDCELSFRACAAYDATRRETDGARWVITGRVLADPSQALPREVARVPEHWPVHPWDGSEFRTFRNYLPAIPEGAIREDATFPHINLNEIVRELLDLT
ncbi:MAG: YcjX family protein [Candidatus Binatia bacterium]